MAGGRVESLISNLDLFPTLLELLGLPIDARVQGRSLLAALDGAPYTPRDEIFGEMTYHDYYDPRRCIRTARHKLIVNFSAAPAFMDPTQSWQPRTSRPSRPTPRSPTTRPSNSTTSPPTPTNGTTSPTTPATPIRAPTCSIGSARWMRETGDPLLAGAVTSPLHRRVVGMLGGEAGRRRLKSALRACGPRSPLTRTEVSDTFAGLR